MLGGFQEKWWRVNILWPLTSSLRPTAQLPAKPVHPERLHRLPRPRLPRHRLLHQQVRRRTKKTTLVVTDRRFLMITDVIVSLSGSWRPAPSSPGITLLTCAANRKWPVSAATATARDSLALRRTCVTRARWTVKHDEASAGSHTHTEHEPTEISIFDTDVRKRFENFCTCYCFYE